MKTVVIYHRADFDGLFCREIARKFLNEPELIGWDYGDPEPTVAPEDFLYILDLSVPGLMAHPNLTWIDHHKSAMEKYPDTIPGYRIDGVAACRLAWQYLVYVPPRATKQDFINRTVYEPLAVRLAGEYDIWDKRDPNAELFQHGLRSRNIDAETWGDSSMWSVLLSQTFEAKALVSDLLISGKYVQYAKTRENESIITSYGFDTHLEHLNFLACNHARFNSQLFTAGVKPHHDGLLGFNFDGKQWRVSLYGVPGKPDIDLSLIATKYGGGGHKQACGFRCETLPFLLPMQATGK